MTSSAQELRRVIDELKAKISREHNEHFGIQPLPKNQLRQMVFEIVNDWFDAQPEETTFVEVAAGLGRPLIQGLADREKKHLGLM